MRARAGTREPVRPDHVQPVAAGGLQVAVVQLEHDDGGLAVILRDQFCEQVEGLDPEARRRRIHSAGPQAA